MKDFYREEKKKSGFDPQIYWDSLLEPSPDNQFPDYGWKGGTSSDLSALLAWQWNFDTRGEFEAAYRELQPAAAIEGLCTTAGGLLMVDDTGDLISCRQNCAAVPPLVVYLRINPEFEKKFLEEYGWHGGVYQYFIEELEHHPECMLCNLVYSNVNKLLNIPDKQLEYSIWPVDQMIPEPEIDKEDDLIKPVYPSPADEYLFAHEVMRYVGSFPLPDAEEMLEIKFKWQSGHSDVNMISEIRAVIFGIDTGWKTISRSDWRTLATISVKDFRHIFVNGVKGKLRPQFWYDYFKKIYDLIYG